MLEKQVKLYVNRIKNDRETRTYVVILNRDIPFQIAVQNGSIDLQPHHIVESYVRTCARFGNMIEVRTGFR